MKYKLFADKECFEFQRKFPDEFRTYGCGPGGVGDFLVPDTVWGLSIREACMIHDWAYRHSPGCSDADRKRHDRILLNNSLRIVDERTKYKWVRYFRYLRCKTYYKMVRAFGGPAYWSEHNSDEPVECPQA